MKSNLLKLFYLALFICINLCNLHAQVSTQPNNPVKEQSSTVAQSLTTAEMQADFDSLRKALEEVHGGLYRFSDKVSINNRFDAYRGQLKSVHDQREFIALLFTMLAETRDGHMRLEMDEPTIAILAKARLFPFQLLIEDSRLMMLYNDTPGDSTIRPGMEVLTINGHKAADMIRTILPGIPGDGFIETGKIKRLERSFAHYYWLFIDQSTEFAITARDATGKTVNTKLPGILSADREKNRNNNAVNTAIQTGISRISGMDDNISFRFLKDADIACLRIRSFGGENFVTTIDSLFKTLHDKKTRALMVDLRGNGGGVDEYGMRLVSQFTNKPFRYFDRIHLTSILPSFTTWKAGTAEELRSGVIADPKGGYLALPKLHDGVAEQSPANYPFSGKVFVLLDGGTFSTAADVTALLRHLTNATFIGEESGGAAEGNTSGLNSQVKLPHLKLGLKIHMYEYWNAVSPVRKGRGTLPDYPIARRVADLLQGIDAPMDRAVELALAKQK